ncbi:Ig-like domain-containing protein [Treponema berlinense]|uniref:Ig-like domain-containing protein n=1 Tax=Treponema berlinense TaxID=225004 RepID=UPI002355F09C|nr:Ig-like domain-containing protein [Treponema berlinense]
MKKMLRIAAALAALLAMTNFIGCKNDDDDDGDETVATVAVEKVEITSTETDVEVGKTITLTAKVSPENATDKTVTWTSSDTTVATVDSSKGVVTGVKEDKVTITAKAGEKTATVEVTVKAAATSGGETGGETGGSTGGTTGGETGGSTGGTTGGETGGSTGGETAPSTKLNVSMDVATLVFADVTEGLTDTAAPDKNGTYMIPASTTILGALTPAKDDKAYWYTDKNRKKISALQLNGEGALNFTLSGAATVKVTFLSTGDTNTSAITVNGTANSVKGKTATEFTWEISEAGDYSILSSGKSNARITKLSIVEK